MATTKFSRNVRASTLCVRIGARIRELRQAKGWTLQLLADHSQIERSHLSRIEAGQREPGLLILERIAQALDVDIKELLG